MSLPQGNAVLPPLSRESSPIIFLLRTSSSHKIRVKVWQCFSSGSRTLVFCAICPALSYSYIASYVAHSTSELNYTEKFAMKTLSSLEITSEKIKNNIDRESNHIPVTRKFCARFCALPVPPKLC